MSLQIALCSFEFETVGGLAYISDYDHDFRADDPPPGASVQPVIQAAHDKIKKCMSCTINSTFHFGTSQVQNINNFLHIGTSTLDAYVSDVEGNEGRMSMLFIAKFYRLEPTTRYKVTLDLEEMPSTLMNWSGYAFSSQMRKYGLQNKLLRDLVKLLDEKFKLDGRIEYTPFIGRGRLDLPRYLTTSDQRVVECDFDKVLFHETSEYQDIKIVSSLSLGNVLLLDDVQIMSEADESYTLEMIGFPTSCVDNMNILILGGGDGALLWELLRRDPKHVTMVEIDSKVIEASKLHLNPWGSVFDRLESDRHKVIIDDCLKQLRHFSNSRIKFDIIFNDLTDVPITKRGEALNAFDPNSVQRDNPWHFIETIFNLSIDCLSEGVGIYITHTTGKGNVDSINAFEKFLRESTKDVMFEWNETYVPSYMEIWRFYTVKKINRDS